MRVDPKDVKRVAKAAVDRVRSAEVTPTTPAATDGAAPVTGSEHVVLSAKAEEVGMAREALQGVPDVRSDRVAKLKQQIEAGTYHVSADEVADKMLNQS
jgi:flagellar biosynthesis anti-sigma factor FlgM